jgi:hypothetical protein
MNLKDKIREEASKHASKCWKHSEKPNEYDNAREDFIMGAMWVVKNCSIPDIVEQSEQLICMETITENNILDLGFKSLPNKIFYHMPWVSFSGEPLLDFRLTIEFKDGEFYDIFIETVNGKLLPLEVNTITELKQQLSFLGYEI